MTNSNSMNSTLCDSVVDSNSKNLANRKKLSDFRDKLKNATESMNLLLDFCTNAHVNKTLKFADTIQLVPTERFLSNCILGLGEIREILENEDDLLCEE